MRAALARLLWLTPLLALGSCSWGQPSPVVAVPTDVEVRSEGTRIERMEGYFPNFVLTTHEGRRVRFYDDLLRGKTVLMNFMYTTCDGI